jgi:pilus assembly protein Flp/PilA
MMRKRDEYGASAVEYGLLVAAIAAVIAIIVITLGGPTIGMFKGACDEWTNQENAGSSCA